MPDGTPHLPSGLTWYPDSRPGITRRRCGKGFTYIAPDGTRIDAAEERARIAALAVPPAYEQVWITPRRNGHLQATGFDARARKQYRYHPRWAEARATEKWESLPEFGRALPRIRRRITRDLAEEPGEERFALAAALMLIDRLSLRVGNETYARENGSYGALTLKRRHLRVTRTGLTLAYTAKGGAKVRRRLTDRKLLRVLSQVRDLPGAELLSWTNEAGDARALSSGALNAYLAEAGGGDFTAKTFRTWAGTLAAYEAAEAGARTIRALSEAAAQRLANTPTVARNAYIHPRIIGLGEAGGGPGLADRETPRLRGLSAAENRLLALLEA